MSFTSTIDDLKALVEKLSDRDAKLKQDFNLFEEFFKNFPIPVTMWSASVEGEVITSKTKGFLKKDAQKIDCLTSDDTAQCYIDQMHKLAVEGKRSQKLVQATNKTYYVCVIPRRNKQGVVTGASGIAWDVSSNTFILDTLIKIKAVTETKSATFEEIAELADEAIQNSRLNSLKMGVDSDV